MNADDFKETSRGHLVPVGGAHAFVPHPLPREVPLDADTIYLLDEASRAVARLDGVGETLANPNLLIAPFLRREAVLSSRIEGTQASVSDVYVAEATGEPRGDAHSSVFASPAISPEYACATMSEPERCALGPRRPKPLFSK